MFVKSLLLALLICVVRSEVLIFEKVVILEEDAPAPAANFSFASSFQDNMVFQMQPYSAVIWGFGVVGATVNVTLGNDIYTAKVVENSNKKGVWKVAFKPQAPGGPHSIIASHVAAKVVSKLSLKNVLFGDVWICGGQSNMEFTVSMGFNATEELKAGSKYPNIRLMTPAEVESDVPLDDFQSIEQPWSLPSADSLGGSEPWTYFSAVCWYFGRDLYEKLQIPIGLVSPNWGGTPIESWSSPKALAKCDLNKTFTYPLKRYGMPNRNANSFLWNTTNPNANSVLWNAMIHPILNMTIKGAIWYQGEANGAYHNDQYSCSFPAMIADWRQSWFEGTGGQTHLQFPFGFVQLSTVNVLDDGSFPRIRWHQTGDYGYVPNPKMPNTFMAVAMDLGDFQSPFGAIHPRDKQDVGARLVLGALNVAYGQHVNPQGPYPVSAVRTGDGHVVVTYPNSQQLNVTENGNFQVCCDFSTCDIHDPSPSPYWWWAPILSHTHNSITIETQVCLKDGGNIALLRYAWALSPCDFKSCSVYNDLGLPAPPFVVAVVDV